jgi:hypothetical protein
MVIIGYILLAVGCIAGLAGGVMFLNVAYRRNLVWFFGCLFVPLVAGVFLFTHWRAAWKLYALSLLGFIAACVGAVVSGYHGS